LLYEAKRGFIKNCGTTPCTNADLQANYRTQRWKVERVKARRSHRIGPFQWSCDIFAADGKIDPNRPSTK